MVKRIASIVLTVLISFSVCACKADKTKTLKINSEELLKDCLNKSDGNTDVEELVYESPEQALAGMKKVAGNNMYELFYSETSMNVAIRNINTNEVFFSNPYDAKNDLGFSGDVAKLLSSQIVISYIGDDYNKHTLFSSSDCAELGQYSICEYKNGVSFNLSIGKELNARAIPLVFTKETYENLYNKLSEDNQDTLYNYYELYHKDELEDNGVLDAFPEIKKSDVYFCSYELNDRETEILAEVFDKAKFTKNRVVEEYKKLGLEYKSENYPNFKMKLEYILTDNGLTVNIPNNSIKFNSEYTLTDISVLPYFGADKPMEGGKGYLLFPDGSGSIIDINGQTENRRRVISGRVYGQDGSLISSLENNDEFGKQIYLPVFGAVRNNGSGYFAVITNGDEYSELYANLGEPNGSYYTVYDKFLYCDSALYTVVSKVASVNSNNSIYLTGKNYAESDFTINYYLLSAENADIKTMSKIYRDNLFGNKKTNISRHDINLVSVGSALCDSTTLGFKVKKETVFTNYSDNEKIISKVKDIGAQNISLLLTGWNKNGLDTTISNGIGFSSVLGGKKDLQKLVDYSKKNRVEISFSNNIASVINESSFDGFSHKKNATYSLDREYANIAKIDPDTMEVTKKEYVVSPDCYNKYASKLFEDYEKLSIKGINLSNLGFLLNSNYSKNNIITRTQTLNYIEDILKKNKDNNLSFNGCNAYILKYASSVFDVPTSNSGYPGETASIPFLQLCIGKNIECFSSAINLSNDKDYDLLSCISTGTIPTYSVAYRNIDKFKKSAYTSYYSIDFNTVSSSIKDSLAFAKCAYDSTKNSFLIDYRIIEKGLTESIFDNGVSLIVNSSGKTVTYNGRAIKSNEYLVVKKGD